VGDNGANGERNSIFKSNKVNERVRFAEPLSLPRGPGDPENGVRAEPKEFKASMSKSYIDGVLHTAATELLQAHLYARRKEKDPLEVIPGGHVNHVPSSQGLPRPRNNELKPIIDNFDEWLPVVDAAMHFNKVGMKRLYDAFEEPRQKSSKIAKL
jgi:hypothetical protein